MDKRDDDYLPFKRRDLRFERRKPGMIDPDRDFKLFGFGIIAIWIIGGIACLAFWGVVIWAIIKVVQHVT